MSAPAIVRAMVGAAKMGASAMRGIQCAASPMTKSNMRVGSAYRTLRVGLAGVRFVHGSPL